MESSSNCNFHDSSASHYSQVPNTGLGSLFSRLGYPSILSGGQGLSVTVLEAREKNLHFKFEQVYINKDSKR